MTRPCCAARISASILPGAVLLLLPKCPLCIAAWLTVATGLSFSPAAAAWLRVALIVLWIPVVAAILCRWRGTVSRRSPSRVP